jgi:hypothetical protein
MPVNASMAPTVNKLSMGFRQMPQTRQKMQLGRELC